MQILMTTCYDLAIFSSVCIVGLKFLKDQINFNSSVFFLQLSESLILFTIAWMLVIFFNIIMCIGYDINTFALNGGMNSCHLEAL